MIQLNKRISLQKQVTYKDPVTKMMVTDWQDIKSVWCAIRTVKGTEYFQASVAHQETTYRFIIRYTAGIDSKMRVNYNGRYFQIESALNDDEANRTITIIAKEII